MEKARLLAVDDDPDIMLLDITLLDLVLPGLDNGTDTDPAGDAKDRPRIIRTGRGVGYVVRQVGE